MIIIRNRRQYEGHNTPLGYYTDQGPQGCSHYDGQGVYCGLSTASEVFLIFTTQLYTYFNPFFLFALLSDEPEVLPHKYFQTAIRLLHNYTVHTAQLPLGAGAVRQC